MIRGKNNEQNYQRYGLTVRHGNEDKDEYDHDAYLDMIGTGERYLPSLQTV